MSAPVISVRGLGKQYRLGAASKPYRTLRESVTDAVRAPFRQRPTPTPKSSGDSPTSFWALRDVNFEVEPGEVIGIIGRNGAGKSTLLKILSRITDPTEGEIEILGRVGSLLEVGTGFHPELTGRENIYLNGAILGMHRAEISKKFDEIVAFAETEKFLDTAVKYYSSGMYTRLAFAVAAHLEPEILVVDEVLAVGDIEFQKKCMGKMGDVARQGRTVLFVSHNMGAILALCTQAIVLAKGSVVFQGDAAASCSHYIGYRSNTDTILSHGKDNTRSLTVESITANGSSSDELELEPRASQVQIEVHGTAIQGGVLDLEGDLFDRNGSLLGHFCPSRRSGEMLRVPAGPFTIRTTVELPALNRGEYDLSFWISHPNVVGHWDFPRALRLTVTGTPLANGTVFDAAQKGPLLLGGQTILQGQLARC